MVGGPSIVFTRKAVVDETFLRKSSNVCKSIVGIDFSQLYPYSMLQPMPTGFYTRVEYDSKTKRFTARQNKSCSLENMLLSYFHQSQPDCKFESKVTTGRQKKIDCFSVDGVCYHCNTVFESMGCCFHYCPCQEARPSLTDNEIMRGINKKRTKPNAQKNIQQKGYKIIEMWVCNWWELYRTDAPVKSYLRANFPYKHPISQDQLLRRIIDGRLFGYVQCDIEAPEHLHDYFSNFPPVFKNDVVTRNNIGDLIKEYAEKEGIMPQPIRMLIWSFILTNCTIITPLFLFYLQLGLVCKKTHRFVHYTPRKCFDNFVQSAVDARRQGDENKNSSVVAEAMKLIANSSFGCQIMDRSRHRVTKYLSNEKTHSAKSSKMFNRLNHITDHLYEGNLSSQKLSTEDQSLWDSLSYSTQNLKCWNFTTISSKNSVTLTSMRNLK